MALPDKEEGGMAIMLGLGKKKPGAGMKDMEADMDMSAKEEAGQALAEAISSGDGAAIADAFQTLTDLCASGGGEDYEEEESEEALDDLEM